MTTTIPRPDRNAGEAPIKQEYRISHTPIVESASADNGEGATADDDAEGSTSRRGPPGHVDGRDRNDAQGGDKKRRKTGKKDRGQNKARHLAVARETGVKICRAWEIGGQCTRGEACKFAHSWESYFSTKSPDIHFEMDGQVVAEPDYVVFKERVVGGADAVGQTLDLSTTCPVYVDLGYCPYGGRCRFLGGHVRKVEATGEHTDPTRAGEWQVLGVNSEETEGLWKRKETNWPNNIPFTLRSNSYSFPFSEKYLGQTEPQKKFTLSQNAPKYAAPTSEEEAMNAVSEEDAVNGEVKGQVDGESEAIDVPLRPEEKKRLNWENGLYLAPLTTVGNLPFRRLCVSYGASITVSEMALAQPLVTGHMEEWALVRRHESEKMFGVQVAGGYPNRMVPTAEMIAKEIGQGVDFVDVNLGCPIDLVFNQGAGSALMDIPGRLGKILVGMNRALGDIPLTVKFRTGVPHNKPNAHKLIPRFVKEWGAGALTLHGRSRQQRYSKMADWNYIKECATVLRETLEEANLPPVPIFGNGDCFSSQAYWEEKERSGVDGIMVARGALIKPWIFTEIAERREWDISATERLEMIRKYAEFGLSHWGSDTQGVSTTRRFLCEALSFQHRYIPIGLLERMPPQINHRPPAYRGRNELETLLASPFAGDWVKISEMFLGKAEDSFNFLPKHKSSAYGSEEAQG